MNLYKSLIYRELKLSRKYYALIGMLLLFLAVSLMIVLILPSAESISADEEAVLPLDLVSIGIGIIGGFMGVRDGGNYNMDVKTGWARTVYALPVTGKQMACAALMQRMISLSAAAVINIAYAIAFRTATGFSVFIPLIAVFLICAGAGLILDTVYGAVVRMFRDKRQQKKMLVAGNAAVIAFFVLIEKAVSLVFKPSVDLTKVLKFVQAPVFAVIGVAFFAASALTYYFTISKSYERREP
ncbi:MAG: hypothetical protein IKI45_06350 [Oscillospiraceae bacterium]|nr:hypothetical protein [Oscillospiraceae bacterium]